MTWPAPWHSIEAEPGSIVSMNRQLQRELSAGHPLHGLPVRAIGGRQDCDDVLFALDDNTGRVAVVHLTWAKSPQGFPWPATDVFDSFAAWAVKGV